MLEAVPDPSVNALATQLCEAALAGLGDDGPGRLRARLLAQRSHLAFYDGEQERVEELSAAALALARAAGDDRRAGQRAAGPAGGVPRAVRSGGAARAGRRDGRARGARRTARARRCGGGSGGSRR